MILWEEILAVMLGGALGSVLRFWVQRHVQMLHLEGGFPYGVLVANIIGSFVIGLLSAVFVTKFSLGPAWRAGIFIGLLGGFTTFSSFSLDTVSLFESGRFLVAGANVFISLTVCLLATTLGLFIGRGIV
jgi:fluoride exporter